MNLTRAIEIMPEDDGSNYLIAMHWKSSGDEAKSRRYLRDALRIAQSPERRQIEDWRTSINTALYLLALNDQEQANKLYSQLLDRNFPKWHLLKGIKDLRDYLQISVDPNASEILSRLEKQFEKL